MAPPVATDESSVSPIPVTKSYTVGSATPRADDPSTWKFHIANPHDGTQFGDSEFEANGLRKFFKYRTLGVRAATGGAYHAHLIRANPDYHGGDATTGPHWHDLTFQLVFVLKGAIAFDYKGVGAIHYVPGTCVLQNPKIHHNELGASSDLVLLEVIGPDPFATHPAPPIDHNDLAVGGPVSENGFKFSVCHPKEDGSDFVSDGLRPFFMYRDLGIKDATNGAYTAHVIKAKPGVKGRTGAHVHNCKFQMIYVVKGWIDIRYNKEDFGTDEPQRTVQGGLIMQKPGWKHEVVDHSDDIEMLEITSPADFPTVPLESVNA